MYVILRKFYRSVRDIERGAPYRVYQHVFDPMSAAEAATVRSKLNTPPLAIDVIVPVQS